MTRLITLTGKLVEVGNDKDGQPRLIIHADKEQIATLPYLPLYIDTEIAFMWNEQKPTDE